jgi:DNA-binding PadR family transcriptional regulator
MIYGSLQRMERDSLVHERSDAGDRRRTFELTRDGRRALVDESARLARLADLARGKGLVRAE